MAKVFNRDVRIGWSWALYVNEIKVIDESWNIDAPITASSITTAWVITSTWATAGIWYATGAWWAVTQATNKQTWVTLSTVTWTITTHAEALAAAAESTFTVTNTAVAITDVIVLSIQSGWTSGEYLAHVTDVWAWSFDITLANMSGSSASDAVLINFAVIKWVVA